MRIDDQGIETLIVESQDLHSDAMRASNQTVRDLTEQHADRGTTADESLFADIRAFRRGRRSLLQRLGLTAGGVGITGAMFNALSSPASAQGPVDIQILQTAASLEILAIATYDAALTLPFIKDGNPVVVKFAQTTRMQHDEHRAAFQAQTKALGGREQTAANAKYAPVVEAAKPTLKTPADVVKLAATLEQVATETYLADLKLLTDLKSKSLFASVMGVECQHLAVLRAVGALLAGAPELIKIPLGADVAKLPAAAGSVAFPEPFQGITMASPPAEGAVK